MSDDNKKNTKDAVNKNKEKDARCQFMSIEETFKEYGTDEKGLTSEEAEKRLEKYGRNELPGKKEVRLWEIILNQIKSPLIYILLAAGAISLAVQEFSEAAFIFLVIAINAALGTFQEWRAEKSAESLQDYLEISTSVVRDDDEIDLPAVELVPGDIVSIGSGDKVPADLRLMKTKNLTLDESLLTGESLPVEKNAEEIDEESLSGEESDFCSNIAYSGTSVSSGRGTGIVIKTGRSTEIGKIAEDVYEAKETKPPLLIRIERFSRQIGLLVLGGVAILAVITFFQGYGFYEAFILSVALAVSAIPEGLPVAVTVALSLGAKRMAKRNVIIRKLSAVESLGSCTLIASDKTGTLTVNSQTAKKIITGGKGNFDISGEGYNSEGKIIKEDSKGLDDSEKKYIRQLVRTVVIDNEAQLKHKDTEDGKEWSYSGNPIDIAFLALAYKAGFKPYKIRNEVNIIGEIPFESENKFSAKFYKENGSNKAAVKGAAEVVIPMCASSIDPSGSITEIDRDSALSQVKDLSSKGYRVIVAAGADLSDDKNDNYKNPKKEDIPELILQGIVGFIDPIRPDVKESVGKAIQAGIKVIMITGDNPETALNIASEINIADKEDEVITGHEIDEELSEYEGSDNDKEKKHIPEEAKTAVKQKKVFARISPHQKLMLIRMFKKIGHFVAVTGDGVNDSPALKAANIGVAMGSGTDVTKDTASIIITDDSFASIVAGIEEGRFAYDNIRKVIYLLLSTGIAEVLLFIAAVSLGLPIALVAVQILWLNMVTNGIQGVGLAFERGEPDTMKRQPRDPQEGVFNSLMLQETVMSALVMVGASFGLWYYLMNNNWPVSEARNTLLLLMVLFQNMHVFNCRSEKTSAFKISLNRNYLLVFGVILALSLHIASMYIPFMQDLLSISPISIQWWGILIALAFSIIVVMEIFKIVKRKIAR